MKLNECLGCGILFSEDNNSIKSLYVEKSGCRHHGEYIDCPVCKCKTIIRRDWGIDHEFLEEKFKGQNYKVEEE